MLPIHSRKDQEGFTLIELMIVVVLGLMVMLGAGAVHRGVYNSFATGARKVTIQQEGSLLALQINRRVRVASDFIVYDVLNRAVPTVTGNGLALVDGDGNVTYRFEWNENAMTLADSTGARVTALSLQNLQFRTDTNFPRTVFYRYQADDEIGNLVDIESASSVRN